MSSALYNSLYGNAQETTPETAVVQSDLPNEVLFGTVAWIGGLNFQISDWGARIDGVIYTGVAEVLTLGAADGTNPRIDVIAFTSSGTAVVVAGTPAATPSKPEVDPSTQVEATFATIAAMATTPSDVSNEDVYLENTEWTSSESDSGTTIDVAATDDPNTGTVHIEFDEVVDGDYIELEDASSHSATEYNHFIFAIKNTVANTAARHRPRIALFNDTTRVSAWIDLRHGTYSFDGSNISDYQNIIIPIADFALGGNQFDTVRFQVEAGGANTLSFLLDDIKFQTGLQVIVQGVTQEDVDIAVLNKPEQVTLVVSAPDGDLEVAQDLAHWTPRYDIEILSVYGGVVTAPDGDDVIFDIHAGGTTIMTTNKIQIDDGETDSTGSATQSALTTTIIAAGTLITVDCDQIGSSTAGAGGRVDILFHQR